MKPHGRRVKPLKPLNLKRIIQGAYTYCFVLTTGFTGFTRLPSGFIRVSYRFHWFHTPGGEMLDGMPGSSVSALRGPPWRHSTPREVTMPCQVCASAWAGAWRRNSLDISPPRRCVSPRSALARLSWTRASCVGARPDCQSLALAFARMSLRR